MSFPNHYQNLSSGIPLVFQHGLGSDIKQPIALLQAMPGIKLFSMECPGHGQSALPGGLTPSFNYYADTLVQLLDQKSIIEAVFGGISMGAGISLNIALRYPECVKALVLVRPAWLDQGTPNNLAILLQAAKWIGQKNGLATFMQQNDFQAIQKVLPRAADSIVGVFEATQRPEIPKVLVGMVQDRPFSHLGDLGKINKPTLIIGNDDDPLHPFEIAQIIHENIAGSRLEKVVSRYVDPQRHQHTIQDLISNFIQNL